MAGVQRREVFGYCMYDFANSSYTTLISTVAFSNYFRLAVVGGEGNRGDLVWSLTAALAYLILIIISPFLGALADHSGDKKGFLLGATIVTVVFCGLLATVTPGALGWAIFIYVIAAVGFETGYIFYNAFLPEVSTPSTLGRISAWSWGLGFVGGLLALVACFPLLKRPLTDAAGLLDEVAVKQWRLSFLVVAIFFAVFAIPTFLFLKNRSQEMGEKQPTGRSPFRIGWERVTSTLTHLREHRNAGRYILGYLFFYGGIETVIKFAAIYATVSFGIEGPELIFLFIVTNIVAVPGTLLAGYLSDWFGARTALIGTLVGWILLLIWGAVTHSNVGFWILAGGIATGMGATQAIGRAFLAQLSPPDRLSEFFGYNIMAGRVGSIIALLAFGIISSYSGNQRLAIFWLVPPFVLGIVALMSIRLPKESAPKATES